MNIRVSKPVQYRLHLRFDHGVESHIVSFPRPVGDFALKVTAQKIATETVSTMKGTRYVGFTSERIGA